MEQRYVDLLYKELSYEVRGAAIEVKKSYGPGHKEVLYQRAFAEELALRESAIPERSRSGYILRRQEE